jgi:RNA polymerase sigma-70 factor (ECF subfamily)
MTDFEALYVRHSRDVYRFALYLCGSAADAEDLTSETFARAWNASGEIRAATAKAYLFTIARNCFLESLRRGPRPVPLEDTTMDRGASTEAAVESRVELGQALRALQRLPELDRTVLLLRVLEEMPYQEIADAVGLSLPAVKVKIHRARHWLARWRTAQETNL